MDKLNRLKKLNRICGGILGVCALIMLLIIGRMGPAMQPTQIEKALMAGSAVMCFVMVYFVGKFKKEIEKLENPEVEDGEEDDFEENFEDDEAIDDEEALEDEEVTDEEKATDEQRVLV